MRKSFEILYCCCNCGYNLLKCGAQIIILFVLFLHPTIGQEVEQIDQIAEGSDLANLIEKFDSIHIVKHTENKGPEVIKTLRGGNLVIDSNSSSKNIYKIYSILDKNDGDLYCLHVVESLQDGELFEQKSKIIRLSWNGVPVKVAVRALTGERLLTNKHRKPELFVSFEEIGRFLESR
jgi:hypothetical protein